MLACSLVVTASLDLSLAHSDEAIYHVVSYFMERPTWQGTEAGHWPMVREKLIPDNNNVGELGNSCPSPFLPCGDYNLI